MNKKKVSLPQKQRMYGRVFHQAVAKAKGLENAEHNIVLELAKIREWQTPKQAWYALDELLRLNFSEPLFRKKYIGFDSNIYKNIRFTTIDSYSESNLVNWFGSFIVFFSKDINEFCVLRDKFYSDLLLGNYQSCFKCIERIEKKFGITNWSVSAQLSLYNFTDDRDRFSQKESEYNQVEHKLSKTILLYGVAKANILVSPDRYKFSLGKMIEEMRLHGDSSGEESILFRHDFDPAHEYKNIKNIMNHDCDARFIDMYSNFIRILSYLYVKKIDLSESKALLKKIKTVIADRALAKLIDRILGVVVFDDLDEKHVHVAKAYYKGEYEKVVAICETVLTEMPYLSAFYEPLSKSLVYLNRKCSNLSGKVGYIIELMCKIIRSEGDGVNNKLLTKIFYTLSYTHWSYSLLAFLDTYSSELTSKVLCSYDFNDSTSLSISLFSMKDINSNFNFNDYEYDDYLRWRKIKLSADANFYLGEHKKAIEEYKLLYEETHNNVHRASVLARMTESYFLDGDMSNAILIASNEIRAGRNISEYPLAPIAKKISEISEYSDDSELLENYAVILNKYNRTIKPDYINIVSNISENILENNKIYSSKELASNIDKFSMSLLYEVFTSDVLDGMAVIFSSTQDVLLTRLAILQYISKTTEIPEIKSKSSTEYRAVYQKLIAAVCSIATGNGKISVDHEQLKSTIIENVENELLQIKKIKNREIGSLPYIDTTVDSNEENSEEDIEYKLVKDEFHNKLHLLLVYILEEYTVNKLYGIDQSLNVGIRHGGIVNWLWSPLRSNNIAANKLSDGKFVADSSWKNKLIINLNYYRDDVLNSVFEKIISFNKDISQFILDTKNSVHVNTGEFIEKDKIFNYVYTIDEIVEIGTHIDDFNAETLIDYVFDRLDAQTESNMLSAKNKFIPNLKGKLDLLFSEFGKSMDKFKIEEISNSIKNAHIEIITRVNDMINWFDWQRGLAVPFKLNIALEKAKQVVEEIYKPLSIHLSGDDKCDFEFTGSHFSKLVSIFSLILENSCKHSYDDSGIMLQSYNITQEGNIIKISFSNKMKDISPDKMSKINKINNEINKSFLDGATKEVGSGTYKIKRILSHEMQVDNNIKVSISNNEFNIYIELEM